jgi:hypothetical protein
MSFLNEAPYVGYYGSKEEKNDKEHDRLDKERKLRMKHGKSWKDFMDKARSSQKKLRPGEVKRFDKTLNKWVSNLD